MVDGQHSLGGELDAQDGGGLLVGVCGRLGRLQMRWAIQRRKRPRSTPAESWAAAANKGQSSLKLASNAADVVFAVGGKTVYDLGQRTG
jgi:hypothetical protein